MENPQKMHKFCKITLFWAPTEVPQYSGIVQREVDFLLCFLLLLNKFKDGSHGSIKVPYRDGTLRLALTNNSNSASLLSLQHSELGIFFTILYSFEHIYIFTH